jgi:endo-alpha-1,4-polygalactosaminidase (GH114 family)
MVRSLWQLLVLVLPVAVACSQSYPPDTDDGPTALPTTIAPRQEATLTSRADPALPPEPAEGTTTRQPEGLPAVADVRRWLYLIDVDLEPETVDEIVASTYDMVVLDFVPSEENNTGYPMADVVRRLHDAAHPKLVVAYIDVGQAEDYRSYWQPGWEIGHPEWIVAGDPDGWEGNYPVAYWYDEYQEVWLGPDGYLQAILDAGFDGVYLDWIEAYSDEDVIALAKSQGLDPVEEMIWWVGDIAEFGRGQPSWPFSTIMSILSTPSPRSRSGSMVERTTNHRATARCRAPKPKWTPRPIATHSRLPAAANTISTPIARST